MTTLRSTGSVVLCQTAVGLIVLCSLLPGCGSDTASDASVGQPTATDSAASTDSDSQQAASTETQATVENEDDAPPAAAETPTTAAKQEETEEPKDAVAATPENAAKPAPKPPAPVVVGQPAPPIQADSVFGQPVSLEQYRGQVVLLDFWATWCGPCIAELPNVKEVYAKHGGGNFAILGVSLDSDRDRLVSFIKDNDMPWQQVFDGQGWQNSTGVSYGVRSIPRMYLLDDNGVVRYENLRGEALQKAVDELVAESLTRLREQLAGDDPDARSLAAFRVGRSGMEDAAGILTKLLHDQSELVQQRATVGLGLVSETIPEEHLPLLRAAAKDSNSDVRAAAFQLLGKANDAELLALATSAIESDSESQVRTAALTAVAAAAAPESLELLEKAAQDESTTIAEIAIRGLGNLGSEPATKALMKLAEDGGHPLRVTIAAALHQTDPAGTADRFAGFLNDDDANVRRTAVTQAASLTDFDGLELYLSALKDSDAGVRKVATVALAESDDASAKSGLQEYFTELLDRVLPQFSSNDRNEQTAAYNELRGAGPAIAVALAKRLADVDERFRIVIARTIGQMDNPAVIKVAAEQLNDTELKDDLRAAYQYLLAEFPDDGRSEIDALANAEAADVRTSGLTLLSNIKDDSSRETLSKNLQHDAAGVRCAAAIGLARQWQDDDALGVLQELCKGDDGAVSQQAVMAISSYPADVALPVLLPIAESDQSSLHGAVIMSLGQISDPRAVAAIVALVDRHPALAAAAMFPLYQQNSADSVAALATFLKHDDTSIQKNARAWLGRMRHPDAQKVLKADSGE